MGSAAPGVRESIAEAYRPSRAGVRALATHWTVTDVLVPFVLTRGALTAVAYVALRRFPADPSTNDLAGRWWIDVWSRWDAFWHLTVALFGYGYVSGGQSNLAFSPLYPAAMKGLADALHLAGAAGYLLAALVVSNLALLAALVALVALARHDHDDATARRAARYYLVFPTTFFLSAAYAESLFLACAIGAFLAARRERWWLAGVLGGLAALARVQGVLVALPLAVDYLARRRTPRADALALGLIPGAFLAWLAYQQARFGDALAFVHAEAAWQRGVTTPWQTVASFFDPNAAHGMGALPLDLAFTAATVALVAWSWRVVPRAQALYATVFLLAALSTGLLNSQARYALLLFPVVVALAAAGRRPLVDRAYVALGMALACAFMALFALRYWVA